MLSHENDQNVKDYYIQRVAFDSNRQHLQILTCHFFSLFYITVIKWAENTLNSHSGPSLLLTERSCVSLELLQAWVARISYGSEVRLTSTDLNFWFFIFSLFYLIFSHIQPTFSVFYIITLAHVESSIWRNWRARQPLNHRGSMRAYSVISAAVWWHYAHWELRPGGLWGIERQTRGREKALWLTRTACVNSSLHNFN